MSKLLPYEEQLQQQWTDIPLPDEDMAWEDMKKRLQEDDDDKGIFFWWRPGCALGGLLLLVLLGLGWWMIRPGFDQKKEKKAQEQHKQEIPAVVVDKKDRFKETNTPPDNNRPKGNKEPVILNAASVQHRLPMKAKNNRRTDNDVTTSRVKTDAFSVKENVSTEKITASDTTGITFTTGHPIPSITQADTATAKPGKKNAVKKPDSLSLAVKPPGTKDSTSKKQFSFSTGIAVLQQLPVGGQKATPYNSQGRKGSLADYIPSVYVRLHNKEKWFLQAEFRYGAPQYSKDLLYQQISISDTGSAPRFTTSTAVSLKKTFYHQLPLTFNYYVLPHWSMGGGVVWNKFYAAISDQETIKRDNVNQRDSVLFKGIVSMKQDTSGSIAKSYFQAVIETQYKWKRFSIGARYAFGLQPYIRFTLPGQGPKEEKNSSLQAFLRFELWRSRQQ